MGTWGNKAFANDDAADWIINLESTSGTRLLNGPIRRALFISKIHHSLPIIQKNKLFQIANYILASGATTYAAAETIAALGRRPCTDFPSESLIWVEANQHYFNKRMAKRAYVAMRFIRNHSELRSLYEDSDSLAEWLEGVDDLLRRLQELQDA